MNFTNNLITNATKTKDSFISGVTDRIATSLIKIISDKIVNRYTFKLVVTDNRSIQKLIEFLKKYNTKLEKKLVNGMFPVDCFSLSIVDENTFVYTSTGNPWLPSSDSYVINKIYREESNSNVVTVYIGGKYAKRVLRIIKKEIEIINKGLVVYNISTNSNEKDKDKESFQSVITDLNERSIDTLFYKDNVKEEIIEYIDLFFKNREIYRERNITFKTGILLYGEPGTGKSSLANALASKYGCNMVLVNINTFDKLDVQTLTSCFNADDLTYVCLLEDIDTLYNINRESDNIDKDDKKVINKLLQFLDSNSSPDNVIFIATTNYIDKLDEALQREGRLGKKFYIGPITEHEAIKMMDSFKCDDEMKEHIMDKIEDKNRINQSMLQGMILDEFKYKTMEEINNEQNKAE